MPCRRLLSVALLPLVVGAVLVAIVVAASSTTITTAQVRHLGVILARVGHLGAIRGHLGTGLPGSEPVWLCTALCAEPHGILGSPLLGLAILGPSGHGFAMFGADLAPQGLVVHLAHRAGCHCDH